MTLLAQFITYKEVVEATIANEAEHVHNHTRQRIGKSYQTMKRCYTKTSDKHAAFSNIPAHRTLACRFKPLWEVLGQLGLLSTTATDS